jgi:hypothetical protein
VACAPKAKNAESYDATDIQSAIHILLNLHAVKQGATTSGSELNAAEAAEARKHEPAI